MGSARSDPGRPQRAHRWTRSRVVVSRVTPPFAGTLRTRTHVAYEMSSCVSAYAQRSTTAITSMPTAMTTCRARPLVTMMSTAQSASGITRAAIHIPHRYPAGMSARHERTSPGRVDDAPYDCRRCSRSPPTRRVRRRACSSRIVGLEEAFRNYGRVVVPSADRQVTPLEPSAHLRPSRRLTAPDRSTYGAGQGVPPRRLWAWTMCASNSTSLC